MQTFGQYIVESLKRYGVECVFGIPGVHTIELYRGLAGSGIRHVTPRHEQGAGFMADGYARVSRKPGVCFIITGPGLTNIATAMGQAYGDSIPMLVLSTVNSAGALGSGEGHLHELPDQSQLMGQVSAFSHTVHHPEEFDTVLARAFAVFESARPRPVHIEIPVEMLSRPVAWAPAPRPLITPPGADADAVTEVAVLLSSAQRPLIIAGGGAAGAADSIVALSERLQAPVLMTINGRGILPSAHPLGLSISAASAPALDLMTQADLLLAIGTELGPTDFDESLKTRRHFGDKLIRVDIDPGQLMRSLLPARGVAGDSRATVEALLGAVAPAERPGWGEAAVMKARQLLSHALSPSESLQIAMLNTLRDNLPGVILVGDSNQPVYAGCTGFAAAGPQSFFNSATGYGTLGYGLPAALGARIAAPDRPVVAIMGDGGLQFTLAEMGSATELDVSLMMILWNNQSYGEIEKAMIHSQVEPLGVRIFTPDFKAIALAFGWEYTVAGDCAALSEIVREASAAHRRLVIEIDEGGFKPVG